jgi:hypothetical protein
MRVNPCWSEQGIPLARSAGAMRWRSSVDKSVGQFSSLQSGILEHIGCCLRTCYDEWSKAPPPKRLRSLAERLDGVLRARLGGPAPAFCAGVLATLPYLRGRGPRPRPALAEATRS